MICSGRLKEQLGHTRMSDNAVVAIVCERSALQRGTNTSVFSRPERHDFDVRTPSIPGLIVLGLNVTVTKATSYKNETPQRNS